MHVDLGAGTFSLDNYFSFFTRFVVHNLFFICLEAKAILWYLVFQRLNINEFYCLSLNICFMGRQSNEIHAPLFLYNETRAHLFFYFHLLGDCGSFFGVLGEESMCFAFVEDMLLFIFKNLKARACQKFIEV